MYVRDEAAGRPRREVDLRKFAWAQANWMLAQGARLFAHSRGREVNDPRSPTDIFREALVRTGLDPKRPLGDERYEEWEFQVEWAGAVEDVLSVLVDTEPRLWARTTWRVARPFIRRYALRAGPEAWADFPRANKAEVSA